MKYRLSWINKVKEFQSLPDDVQDNFCSFCGCEGGCNLCKDLNTINEDDIYDDTKDDK